jgi:NADH-quinone oxidoreductase subunit M
MTLRLPIAIAGHPVVWQLQFGADSLSASMVLLSGIVTLAVLLMALNQITHRTELYAGLILMTQSLLNGVFVSMDLLLFYVFFEAVLIPIIVLINVWGDPKVSLRASRKFLLYTLAGSIPMVVGLVGLVVRSATPDRPTTVLLSELSGFAYASQLEVTSKPVASNEDASEKAKLVKENATTIATSHTNILFTLLLGLGIKMAILPFHSWLPTTYEAAHPNTTALIAAVVGKLGVYGMLRIVLPLVPLSMIYYFQILFGALGAIAIVYGAMIALGQTDLRRLLAYSSLSHLGFVTLGLSVMNREGLAGASIQMLNHGLLTAALFLLLASIEQRRGRLAMTEESRGLASAYPRIGTLMVFFTLAAAGLPGLNSFVGELLAMTGMLRVSLPITAIAVLGTVLGAWYSLRVLQYIMFGSDGRTQSKPHLQSDIGMVELSALIPIAALCLAIGVYPNSVLNFMKRDTDKMASALEPAVKVLHPRVDSSMLLSQSE